MIAYTSGVISVARYFANTWSACRHPIRYALRLLLDPHANRIIKVGQIRGHREMIFCAMIGQPIHEVDFLAPPPNALAATMD